MIVDCVDLDIGAGGVLRRAQMQSASKIAKGLARHGVAGDRKVERRAGLDIDGCASVEGTIRLRAGLD